MAEEVDVGRGARLALARRARAMTQEVLGRAAGVSSQTVKRAEAGRPVQAENLEAICAVLDLETRDLAAPLVAVGGTPIAARTPAMRWDAFAAGVLWLLAILAEDVGWSARGETVTEFRAAQCVALALACAGALVPLARSLATADDRRRRLVAGGVCAVLVGLAAWPVIRLRLDFRAARAQVVELQGTLTYATRVLDARDQAKVRTLRGMLARGHADVDRLTQAQTQDAPRDEEEVTQANVLALRNLELLQAANGLLVDMSHRQDAGELVPASLRETLRDGSDGVADTGASRASQRCNAMLRGARPLDVEACASAMTPTRFDHFEAFVQAFSGGRTTGVDQDDLDALRARLASDEFLDARDELAGGQPLDDREAPGVRRHMGPAVP